MIESRAKVRGLELRLATEATLQLNVIPLAMISKILMPRRREKKQCKSLITINSHDVNDPNAPSAGFLTVADAKVIS
jgi:hypothetical protein